MPTFRDTPQTSVSIRARQYLSKLIQTQLITASIYTGSAITTVMAHASSQRWNPAPRCRKPNQLAYLMQPTISTCWIAATGPVSASWAVPSNAVSGFISPDSSARMPRRAQAISRLLCAMTTAALICCSRPPTPPGRRTTDMAGTALYGQAPKMAVMPIKSVTTVRLQPAATPTEESV